MIVAVDSSIAGRARRLIDQGTVSTDDGVALAKAAVAEAVGQRDEAMTALTNVSGPFSAVAQLKLGLLASSQGRDATAITHVERAANLDSDGMLTDSIAFRTPGIRTQLIILFSKAGRHTAAIRIAETETSGRRTPALDALRAALMSGSVRHEVSSVGRVVFEPRLEPRRPAEKSLRTLLEMSEVTATASQQLLLNALSLSTATLGQYDRAIALERLRASTASKPEEKSIIEKRLAELTAAERERQLRLASLLRMTRSNATTSVYAARFPVTN
jgi:hypothetical protein